MLFKTCYLKIRENLKSDKENAENLKKELKSNFEKLENECFRKIPHFLINVSKPTENLRKSLKKFWRHLWESLRKFLRKSEKYFYEGCRRVIAMGFAYIIIFIIRLLVAGSYDTETNALSYYGRENTSGILPFNYRFIMDIDFVDGNASQIEMKIEEWLDSIPSNASTNWVVGKKKSSESSVFTYSWRNDISCGLIIAIESWLLSSGVKSRLEQARRASYAQHVVARSGIHILRRRNWNARYTDTLERNHRYDVRW